MQIQTEPIASRTVVPLPLAQGKRLALFRAFWAGIALLALVVAVTAHPQYIESVIGAVLISVAALVPAWLWVLRKVRGLPLFPVYAITHIWTYALPLLYEHPIVAMFPADSQMIGALSVTGFLLIGTACWYGIGKGAAKPVWRTLTLNHARADALFMAVLAGGAIFNVAMLGGWLPLAPGIQTILRAGVAALEALGCFVLSFRLGERELRAGTAMAFMILLPLLVLATLPSLVMITAMSFLAVALLGFTLGRRQFPWKTAGAVVCLFAFLHSGKSEMRDRYWHEQEVVAVPLTEYPAFFQQWVAASAEKMFSGSTAEEEEGQSLLERASLMQLLLYVQSMSPENLPFLYGETYRLIPSLLVPRIFNPQKPPSHEGTYILNIHYGLQTREAAERTTIGFGLLNESFANFGYLGMALLGAVMGGFYAAVARLARNVPILSLRSLFAILVASYSFQTEFAAGVYVTALFQSTMALLGLAVVFMRPQAVEARDTSLID